MSSFCISEAVAKQNVDFIVIYVLYSDSCGIQHFRSNCLIDESMSIHARS